MGLPITYGADGNDYVGGPMRSRHRAVTHNWDLVLTHQDGFPDNLQSLWGALTQGNADQINVHCQSISIPNTNISTVEGNIRGVRFHQIQTRQSTPVQTNLVFYEPYDYRLYEFFEMWKSEMVGRRTGRQNPYAWIPEGVEIVLYTHDRDAEVLSYPLYDTYCISAQISDPSGAANLQTVSVTLQSSNYGIKVNNVEGVPAFQDVPSKYLGTVQEYATATKIT